ncbi:MAG: hypothetical protein AB7S26_01160 [Sandaracinaceae bacterium]
MAHWSKRSKSETSYLMEMLKHKYSLYSGLGSLGLAFVLSIPFSFGVALLPVLGWGAGAALAALFIPGSRWWRDKVDREKETERRESARKYMLGEIQKRVDQTNRYWEVYRRLLDRRDSLRKMADARESALSQEEVDRLDDATVDFLGLWLGRIAIYERHQAFSADDLERRIKQIDRQLEDVEATADKRRLLKAKKDLEDLVRRRDEMLSRDAAADAAMLSMADTFDEVYQRLMANPNSKENVRVELEQAVNRMNIEEELDYVLEEEVEAFLEGGK